MSNQEQERLRKLREQQLQARDPLAKQRKFQQSSSRKEKRMRKSLSFSDVWNDIPHVVKVPLYGLIVGLILVVMIPKLWNSQYAIMIAGGLTLFFIIFGVFLGNALDIRDKLRDDIK